MNYVSYSLYGDSPKYCVGAVANARRVPEAYPGFTAVFFIETSTVPKSVIDELKAEKALCVAGSRRAIANPMIWRTMATEFRGAEIVLFRDADSRITKREVAAVQEWQQSSFRVHVMRDFPKHTMPLMGGTWGIKKHLFPGLSLANIWGQYKRAALDWDAPNDQIFYARELWPLFEKDTLQHDEFNDWPNCRPFPVPFDPAEGFVGEVILENGEGIPEHKAYRGIAPFLTR